jgi:hypothetical protein
LVLLLVLVVLVRVEAERGKMTITKGRNFHLLLPYPCTTGLSFHSFWGNTTASHSEQQRIGDTRGTTRDST